MPDGPRPPRLFSPAEATAILSRAVERQSASTTGLTYAELVDAGRQAGIAAEAIDEAITDVARRAPAPHEAPLEPAALDVRTWKSRRAFAIHFSIFVMANLLLAFLNWMSWRDGEHVPWFLIPLLTWGIGLATHFTVLLFGHVFPDPRVRARASLDERGARVAAQRVRVEPRETEGAELEADESAEEPARSAARRS